LLYVIHGPLQLVRYDHLTAGRAAEMRAAEQRVFARLGIEPSATTLGLRKGDLVE